MSVTTMPMLTVYPGAPDASPPEGHSEQRVPPAQMRDGDRLLLAGRIRSVWRPTFDDAGRFDAVMLYALEDGSGVDRWKPETGDLPIAIWRASRAAPRDGAITEGRPTGPFLIKAATIRTRPTLGRDVIEGLKAIPKLPKDQDNAPHWNEVAQFDAFERTRPEPEPDAVVTAHTPGSTAEVLAALAIARRNAGQQQSAAAVERF